MYVKSSKAIFILIVLIYVPLRSYNIVQRMYGCIEKKQNRECANKHSTQVRKVLVNFIKSIPTEFVYLFFLLTTYADAVFNVV